MPHATLRVSALALAALLALAAGTAPPPPLPPKDAPLAVVGGGVAGLFLATLLADAGYGDITVFEAADRIVSLASWVGASPACVALPPPPPAAPQNPSLRAPAVQAPTSCTAMVEGDAYDCSIVGVQVGGPNSTVQVRESGVQG